MEHEATEFVVCDLLMDRLTDGQAEDADLNRPAVATPYAEVLGAMEAARANRQRMRSPVAIVLPLRGDADASVAPNIEESPQFTRMTIGIETLVRDVNAPLPTQDQIRQRGLSGTVAVTELDTALTPGPHTGALDSLTLSSGGVELDSGAYSVDLINGKVTIKSGEGVEVGAVLNYSAKSQSLRRVVGLSRRLVAGWTPVDAAGERPPGVREGLALVRAGITSLGDGWVGWRDEYWLRWWNLGAGRTRIRNILEG